MKILTRLFILSVVLAGASARASGQIATVLRTLPAVTESNADCTFTLDSTTAHFTTAGGSSNVTVSASGTNCSWTAVSYSPFVTITSATNFTGDGVVTYIVPDNTNLVGFTSSVIIAGQEYLVVQDAFTVPAGTYNGVFVQTNAPTQESSGSINLILRNTGTFTARLTMGSVRTLFRGRFDGAGNSTNLVSRHKASRLQVLLQLDIFNGANNIAGTVSDGVFTSALVAAVSSQEPDKSVSF